MQCLSKTGFIVKRRIGYSWLPFGRASENRFVAVLAGIERFLGLRMVPRFSPWVIMYITKIMLAAKAMLIHFGKP